MKTPPARRTRLLLPIAGAAAVLAAVLTFALTGPASQFGKTPAAGVNPMASSLAPTLPALAAADSDTVVMAPYTGAWWKKVAAMAPAAEGLLALDPAASGAPLLRVGYTRGPDHTTHDIPNTGPLRLTYLETPSAGDAAHLADWLKERPLYENRRVSVQDRTVIIGQTWNTGFTVPAKTMQTVSGYQPGDATSKASMWMNVDQEVTSLAGGPQTASGKVYAAVLSKGIGFRPGTTWTGFSDTGDAWAGDYRSGGVDKAQIDFDAAQQVVSAAEKVLYEKKSGMVTTTAIDPGTGSLLMHTSIAAGDAMMGSAAGAGNFPKVDNQIVSVVSDVAAWNAAATGNTTNPESLRQRTISANGTSMVVSFTGAPPAG